MIGVIPTSNKPAVRLPYPHPGQRAVLSQARRFNWLSAGRRWRKTTLAMSIVVEAALKGGVYLWVAPTYDQVGIGMDEVLYALGREGISNGNTMSVFVPYSGGKILFRSMSDPNNARGHTANGVVMDEAAYIKPEAWVETLRPMLMDTGGWAWGISTPNGRNWFWDEFRSTRDFDDYMAWQISTRGAKIVDGDLHPDPHPLENPYVPFSEVYRMWRKLPQRVFEQEVLAQFVDDAGGVFRRVMEAATATPQDSAIPGHQYIMGIDWARSQDFTVLAIVDATLNQLVYLDRFNQIDYAVQRGRVLAAYERFRPDRVIAETNAMGLPMVEQLLRDGLPVEGFTTTNATKAAIIDALALAFEQGALAILPDAVLINELQSYEMERSPAGLMRYSAPAGMHDDTVMALAMAWYGAAAEPAVAEVSRYVQRTYTR